MIKRSHDVRRSKTHNHEKNPSPQSARKDRRIDLGGGAPGQHGGDLPPGEYSAEPIFYRWKQKFKEAGIVGLQSMKRGPKTRDLEKEKLVRENVRLTTALCESSIELQLLKKSVSSDYMDR